MDPEYEAQLARHGVYVAERESLKNASLEIGGRYDKWVLTLSGGALALSITFVEKIAPHPKAWTTILLFIAWALFLAALLFGLHALATSQSGWLKQIRILDEEYRDSLKEETNAQPGPAGRKNKFIKRTNLFNTLSLHSLSLGVLVLCFFSAFNLPSGKRAIKHHDKQRHEHRENK